MTQIDNTSMSREEAFNRYARTKNLVDIYEMDIEELEPVVRKIQEGLKNNDYSASPDEAICAMETQNGDVMLIASQNGDMSFFSMMTDPKEARAIPMEEAREWQTEGEKSHYGKVILSQRQVAVAILNKQRDKLNFAKEAVEKYKVAEPIVQSYAKETVAQMSEEMKNLARNIAEKLKSPDKEEAEKGKEMFLSNHITGYEVQALAIIEDPDTAVKVIDGAEEAQRTLVRELIENGELEVAHKMVTDPSVRTSLKEDVELTLAYARMGDTEKASEIIFEKDIDQDLLGLEYENNVTKDFKRDLKEELVVKEQLAKNALKRQMAEMKQKGAQLKM